MERGGKCVLEKKQKYIISHLPQGTHEVQVFGIDLFSSPDDGRRDAGTNPRRNHQKGAVHQRSSQL